ncbi:hypothetical protein L0F63_005351 [Massospora cicadina]|nr:hypothetical protein L0F63_005351 [Massospora cicadina]
MGNPLKRLDLKSCAGIPIPHPGRAGFTTRALQGDNFCNRAVRPKTEAELIDELSECDDLQLEDLSTSQTEQPNLYHPRSMPSANLVDPILHTRVSPDLEGATTRVGSTSMPTPQPSRIVHPSRNDDRVRELTVRPTLCGPNRSTLAYPASVRLSQSCGKPWDPSAFASNFLKPLSHSHRPPKTKDQGRLDLSTQLWTEALTPKDMDHVVVSQRKVKEVRDWLTSVVGRKTKTKLLVLDGPPGTGRSSLIRALAKELRLRVVEWVTPDSVGIAVSEPNLRQESAVGFAEQFQKFIQASARYQPLGSKADACVEHVPTRLRVQKALRAVCRDPRTRFPIVLISSSLGSAVDWDSDQVERSSYSLSPCSLVWGELFTLQLASRICFNPVAPTFICKALVHALELRYDVLVPNKSMAMAVLREIAESVQGDLRAAINELQLRSLKASHHPGSPLNLFHALSKVFYCKWEAGVMQLSPESFLSSCPVALSLFGDFLFQNYPPFLTTIDQCFLTADAFSFASTLRIPWGQDPRPQATALMCR